MSFGRDCNTILDRQLCKHASLVHRDALVAPQAVLKLVSSLGLMHHRFAREVYQMMQAKTKVKVLHNFTCLPGGP